MLKKIWNQPLRIRPIEPIASESVGIWASWSYQDLYFLGSGSLTITNVQCFCGWHNEWGQELYYINSVSYFGKRNKTRMGLTILFFFCLAGIHGHLLKHCLFKNKPFNFRVPPSETLIFTLLITHAPFNKNPCQKQPDPVKFKDLEKKKFYVYEKNSTFLMVQ